MKSGPDRMRLALTGRILTYRRLARHRNVAQKPRLPTSSFESENSTGVAQPIDGTKSPDFGPPPFSTECSHAVFPPAQNAYFHSQNFVDVSPFASTSYSKTT